jgi:hypothetical protein
VAPSAADHAVGVRAHGVLGFAGLVVVLVHLWASLGWWSGHRITRGGRIMFLIGHLRTVLSLCTVCVNQPTNGRGTLMTGPQHYKEAVRLLEQAESDARDPMRKYAEDANLIAAAQVHATLALAAATAYKAVVDYTGDEDGSVSRGWADVA